MQVSHNKNSDVFFLAEQAGAELISRLPLLSLQPENILFLGQCSHQMKSGLQEIYPQAKIKTELETIADQSIDLIIANFCLPWIRETAGLLPTWRRVLRADGVLSFNAFGVKTLQAYQAIWSDAIVPGFSDIHLLGDSLTQAGFQDPVLDCDYVEVQYQDAGKMLREMQANNVLAIQSDADFEFRLTQVDSLHLLFEIIQAHAFAPTAGRTRDGVASIPLDEVKKNLRERK